MSFWSFTTFYFTRGPLQFVVKSSQQFIPANEINLRRLNMFIIRFSQKTSCSCHRTTHTQIIITNLLLYGSKVIAHFLLIFPRLTFYFLITYNLLLKKYILFTFLSFRRIDKQKINKSLSTFIFLYRIHAFVNSLSYSSFDSTFIIISLLTK